MGYKKKTKKGNICAMSRLMLIIVSSIFLISQNGIAQGDREKLFSEGSNAFRSEKYEDAVKYYETIVEHGSFSAGLHANLGTAHLKLGNIGEAILNFEKSLLIDPRNVASHENIAIARERIEDAISHIPDFIVMAAWRNFVQSIGVSSWLYLHGVFLLVAIGLLFILWWDVPNELFLVIRDWKFSIPAVFAAFLFSLFFLFVSMQRAQQLRGVNYGIVMQHESALRNGPDNRSTELLKVSEGSKVRILDHLNEWYKIQLEDKDEGWIETNNIALIRIMDIDTMR